MPQPARLSLMEARKKLETAERARLEKRRGESKVICRELLRQYPDYVGALQTLGLALADDREYEESSAVLSRAAMHNPKDWKILTALAGVYLKLGASEMAILTLEQAERLNPQDVSILLTLGEIYREEREYELAAETHRKAFTHDPSLLSAFTGFGLSCTHMGRLDEAAWAFEELVARGSRTLTTLFSLAQLPTSLIKSDLFPLLEQPARLESQKPRDFDIMLEFTKAAALEKRGQYEASWKCLRHANQMANGEFEESYPRDAKARAQVLKYVSEDARILKQIENTSLPVSLYIIGPSRSGKTTLERIASVLAGVKRGYENPILESAVKRTFQSAGLITRNRLLEMPDGLKDRFLSIYSGEIGARASGAKVFTNTHPGRIFDVWRLAETIPNPRFIFVKRNSDDLAMRIYTKRFQAGHPYAYDLKKIREYVEWYHNMMDVLAAKLPSITRIVHYEDIVVNPTAAINCAAELCGLTFDERKTKIGPVGDDRGAAKNFMGFDGWS